MKLLPRLKNKNETEVVIVALPEATPYFEAYRLEEDLNRADIDNKWWVINASLLACLLYTSVMLDIRDMTNEQAFEKVEKALEDMGLEV